VRDVEYLLHKGTYRLKALTPRARRVFAAFLDLPPDLAEQGEIFIQNIAPDRWPHWQDELTKHGFQLENDPPPPVDVSKAWEI
jgi:hypothetical protein